MSQDDVGDDAGGVQADDHVEDADELDPGGLFRHMRAPYFGVLRPKYRLPPFTDDGPKNIRDVPPPAEDVALFEMYERRAAGIRLPPAPPPASNLTAVSDVSDDDVNEDEDVVSFENAPHEARPPPRTSVPLAPELKTRVKK